VIIAHAELGALVSTLLTCEHKNLNNPQNHRGRDRESKTTSWAG
jgi:hypothetical protein